MLFLFEFFVKYCAKCKNCIKVRTNFEKALDI